MWKRLTLSSLIGLASTLAIFYFMSALVSNSGKYLGDGDSGTPIEFLRIKQDDNLQTRTRRIPKKPEAEKPPEQPKLKVAQPDAPSKPQMSMDMPKVSHSLALGDGPFLGSGRGPSSSGEVVPLVRIEPQYPRKARMKGTEGWVEVQFDVTESGSVRNVRVLESQPRRLFDSSARRAILKWKYRPKVINGKSVAQKGLKTRFNFKMEGE